MGSGASTADVKQRVDAVELLGRLRGDAIVCQTRARLHGKLRKHCEGKNVGQSDAEAGFTCMPCHA